MKFELVSKYKPTGDHCEKAYILERAYNSQRAEQAAQRAEIEVRYVLAVRRDNE